MRSDVIGDRTWARVAARRARQRRTAFPVVLMAVFEILSEAGVVFASLGPAPAAKRHRLVRVANPSRGWPFARATGFQLWERDRPCRLPGCRVLEFRDASTWALFFFFFFAYKGKLGMPQGALSRRFEPPGTSEVRGLRPEEDRAAARGQPRPAGAGGLLILRGDPLT